MDTINHYVGMYPIAAGGVIERAFSPFLITMLGIMLVGFMIPAPKLRLGVMAIAFAMLLSTVAAVSFSSCGDDESPQGVLNVSGATVNLQVSCSVSPSAGLVPLTVSLTTSVQGNTPSYRLVVDFGDGTTGDNGNVTHVYGTPGTYAIRVSASAEGQAADCR